ncbi:MAG: hypothetical protein LBM98_09670 [Oscillospiraceae bacterium]|nr:hypothetical protein [Oscillospiraceae bacterium]
MDCFARLAMTGVYGGGRFADTWVWTWVTQSGRGLPRPYILVQTNRAGLKPAPTSFPRNLRPNFRL